VRDCAKEIAGFFNCSGLPLSRAFIVAPIADMFEVSVALVIDTEGQKPSRAKSHKMSNFNYGGRRTAVKTPLHECHAK